MPPSVGWLKEESVRGLRRRALGVKPLGGCACAVAGRIAFLPVAS